MIETIERGDLEPADRIVAFEGGDLRERVWRASPHWADEPIRSWDEIAFRRLEPFTTSIYWTDQGSINIYRVVGTQHPDYQGRPWQGFLEGGKRMELNLALFKSNPAQPKKPLRQLLLLLILMNAPSAMAAPRVEVFTDRDHPVTRAEAFADTDLKVYRLDGLVLAKKKLSEGLPANESQAAKIAGKRFEAQRPTLAPRMMEAGEGLVQALLNYRLDRYPAIVFDGKSVIYGITDLAVARRLYKKDQGAGERR